MKYTKKLWIGPTIMLALFLLTIGAMSFSETKLTKLFAEHSSVLKKVPGATPSEQKQLLKDFASSVELSGTSKNLLALSKQMQKTVDRITPGKPHCLTSLDPPCAVYKGEIISAAKDRHNTLIQVMGKKPKKISVLNGIEYAPYDYFVKGMIMVIIGLVINMIVLAIYLMYTNSEATPEQKKEGKQK